MAKILIKGLYTIRGKLINSADVHSFNVCAPNEKKVIVKVVPKKDTIESIQEVEVSNQLLYVMESGEYGNLSEELESELAGLTNYVSMMTRRVLSIIKYCLNQYEIDEELMSSKGTYWSKDGNDWKRISQRLHLVTWVSGIQPINEEGHNRIQSFLDSGYEPFLALRHLHRAQKENNPRHQWIEATIAAELAIKEFLIRYKPDLETLLIELPSPPLDKMYRQVLNHYAKPLPKNIVNELKNGAEIRNRLLHRPSQERIDGQKARNYVDAVAEAIRHLLTTLNPDDKFSV
jgi:hypothetical protein